MLKIGDFSKLSRISIRMLRNYADMGLLVPAEVDKATGYRYYSESQLPQAAQIQMLKNMGFGLSTIDAVLQKYQDVEEMEQFLMVRRTELIEQQRITQERLQFLDAAIKHLKKEGNTMHYNVTLKTLPERYVASVRQVIPSYRQEGMLWEMLYQETGPQKVRPAAPAYALAIFHDEGYKESDVDVEIQTTVMGTYEDTEHVIFKKADSILMASSTYKGSYEHITAVNEAVANWIQENGYELEGSSFCIYHLGPCDITDPEEMVTEVCHPVRRKRPGGVYDA
ncbi:MerR family transcriptional regulator [Bariatricus massiliensis]|uniref:MerR family transcriptional regulator n=1 Tax=Bariatricus massiliensis TaxID=1745713 RepID=A0ABS8DF36_9FIRM|nr:MerR family transcriptional regulator [Bariatricus massiliensis]MCB7303921.1 MerR family transcriptional regulator [Bariatricus massiliensis]MCB7374648.1 MerR family transcriptional regulator [Bariatricus massiliensis]MCB7387031.1 MerR family transcriptional regulator [Bariatricus massiliensis]MCB7411193.1 MerR family transcriptional regulator [Bariatricus massiliensis]MCQ5252863.1 MerR family transcriptional regulator [Bariatricus massiliensis]